MSQIQNKHSDRTPITLEGRKPQQHEKKRARGPGALLSIIVPGFGLFRAGLYKRGICWLIGIEILCVLTALLFATEFVPVTVAAFAFVILLLAVFIGWIDGFRPGKMTLRLWALFVALVALYALLPSIGSLVAKAFVMPTGAMEPTLLGERSAKIPDHIIVDRVSYKLAAPKRGDLIVFSTSSIPTIRKTETTEEVYFVKRLVGLPGERIKIADSKLYANGKLLDESDGIPPLEYFKSPASNEEFSVGEGEYFVLGDNSKASYDSRYWGNVPKACVFGKVTMIYYPLNRLGRPVTQARQKHP